MIASGLQVLASLMTGIWLSIQCWEARDNPLKAALSAALAAYSFWLAASTAFL